MHQLQANELALEDRVIGFMKENRVTSEQLVDILQKIQKDEVTDQQTPLSLCNEIGEKIALHTGKTIEQVTRDLLPGGVTPSGLLKLDQSLIETIEEDHRVLQLHGITHEQLADELERIIVRYSRMNSDRQYTSSFGQLLLVTPHHPRIIKRNPLSQNGQKYRFSIQVQNNKHTINITNIHPWMIREFRFFEGKGSEYRVDPLSFAKMIGLIK